MPSPEDLKKNKKSFLESIQAGLGVKAALDAAAGKKGSKSTPTAGRLSAIQRYSTRNKAANEKKARRHKGPRRSDLTKGYSSK